MNNFHSNTGPNQINSRDGAHLEIDLSAAVTLRQALRVLLFIAAAFFSVALTDFQGAILPTPRQTNLLVSDFIILILLIGSDVSLNRPRLCYAVLGSLLIFSGTTVGLSAFGHSSVIPPWAAVLGTVVFGTMAVIGPVTAMNLRTLRVLELSSGKRKSIPYWAFVIRNAPLRGLDLISVIATAACVAALAVLPFLLLFGFLLIPCLVCIRLICAALFRRLSRKVTWAAISRDRARRGACLYLRSFWDDDFTFARASVKVVTARMLWWVFLVAWWLYLKLIWNLVAWVFEPRKQPMEEVLVRAVWPSYGVIAIGNSSSDNSPMAAVRFPLENDDWQSAAAELVQSAQLVVLQAGFTSGVKWEHEHLKSESVLYKTLVVFPPEGEDDRRERWDALMGNEYLGVDSSADRHRFLFASVPREEGLTLAGKLWARAIGALPPRDQHIIDRTVACAWNKDGRRIHFTSRSNSRLTYDLALRLACAPRDEVVKLAVQS